MGKNKDSSTAEAKLHVQAKTNKECIHYFPMAGRCLITSWKARLQYV